MVTNIHFVCTICIPMHSPTRIHVYILSRMSIHILRSPIYFAPIHFNGIMYLYCVCGMNVWDACVCVCVCRSLPLLGLSQSLGAMFFMPLFRLKIVLYILQFKEYFFSLGFLVFILWNTTFLIFSSIFNYKVNFTVLDYISVFGFHAVLLCMKFIWADYSWEWVKA